MEEALCDPSSSLVQCYSVYPFVTVWGGGVGWGGREGRGEKKNKTEGKCASAVTSVARTR